MKFLTNSLTIVSLVWSSAMIINVVAVVHPTDAAVPESSPTTLVVVEADERASPTASSLHDSFRQLVAPFFAPKEEDVEVLVYNNSEDTTEDDDEESVVLPRRGLAHLRGSAQNNNPAADRTLYDYGGNAYGYRAVGGRTHYRTYNNGGYGRSYGYGDNDNYEYGRGGGYSGRYSGDNDRYEYSGSRGGKRYGYNGGGYSRYGGGGGYGRYGDNDRY